MAVSDNLKRLREKSEDSLKQVAGKLKVSYESYRRWEAGERPVPHARKIQLAELHKVSLAEIENEFSPGESTVPISENLLQLCKKIIANESNGEVKKELVVGLAQESVGCLGR